MSAKYTVTENFKSAEKDRKISFLNKLVNLINATVRDPSEKSNDYERWKQT